MPDVVPSPIAPEQFVCPVCDAVGPRENAGVAEGRIHWRYPLCHHHSVSPS